MLCFSAFDFMVLQVRIHHDVMHSKQHEQLPSDERLYRCQLASSSTKADMLRALFLHVKRGGAVGMTFSNIAGATARIERISSYVTVLAQRALGALAHILDSCRCRQRTWLHYDAWHRGVQKHYNRCLTSSSTVEMFRILADHFRHVTRVCA